MTNSSHVIRREKGGGGGVRAGTEIPVKNWHQHINIQIIVIPIELNNNTSVRYRYLLKMRKGTNISFTS